MYFYFMSTAINIHDILSKVSKLDKEEQVTLLEMLVALIRKDDSTKFVKLSDISGIGSNVWKQTNIDEYIVNERQWLNNNPVSK